MKRAKITIKNYRGYADSEPVIIEIGPGFTALLGRNNAGKSSFKLFFYELRFLFQKLCQMNTALSPSFFTAINGEQITTEYLGISDPEELFNNTNNRPLSLEIEILGAVSRSRLADCIVKIICSCDRNDPKIWRVEAFGSLDPKNPLKSPNGFHEVKALTVASPDGSVEFDAIDLYEVLRAIVGARYYGPFRNALNQGAGEHFDLRIGTAFIDLWSEWKTSGVKAKTRAIDQVTEDIRKLFEFDRLEINASPPLKTLIVSVDGQPYRLGELGSGIAQFIMVLGNAATTKPSLVLIDEPETNLHPSLQIDFLLALAQYAQYGCLFSTHSVGLARSVADRIYSFQKGSHGPVVRPFETTSNYSQFVGELSFSSFKEMGADRLLLVEGVNDVKAVQQLLRLVSKEHTTVILPLGGDQLASGGRDAELSELTRLSSNIFALVDSERTKAGEQPAVRRLQFGEACRRIGIDVCVTEYRAIENYFPDRAVKAALGGSFQSLGPYDLLKDSSNPWGKTDNWKIARQMDLADLVQTDVGAFIERM
jgi:energy-coupling factor transporter ATP-binding protein EcfA2